MSFLSNFRADRLITQIKSSNDILGTETQKSVAKLKELGPSGIEAVLAALPDADKHATVALVDVLSALATAKSFPTYVEALITGSPRVIAGVAWALTSSRGFPPAARGARQARHLEIRSARNHQRAAYALQHP
jgi:hypothetical protein